MNMVMFQASKSDKEQLERKRITFKSMTQKWHALLLSDPFGPNFGLTYLQVRQRKVVSSWMAMCLAQTKNDIRPQTRIGFGG